MTLVLHIAIDQWRSFIYFYRVPDFHDRNNPDNATRGLILGLSATGVIVGLLHILHIVHSIHKASETQKESKIFNDAHSYIILTDSITGKKDTLRLADYMEREKLKKDSSVKKAIILPQ